MDKAVFYPALPIDLGGMKILVELDRKSEPRTFDEECR